MVVIREELIDMFSKELLVSGAIVFGKFKLRSGRVSPYYIDLRILVSKPRLLSIAIELMSKAIESISPKPTKLCGIPMTGSAIVSAIAAVKGVPGMYIRKEPMIYRDIIKKISANGNMDPECIGDLSNILDGFRLKNYGISRLVDGIIDDGDKILLIDDVITTGNTKLETIEILEEEARRRGKNIEILGVAVLTDREEGGANTLARRGVKLYRVAGIRRIIGSLEKQGLLGRDVVKDIERYLEEVSIEG